MSNLATATEKALLQLNALMACDEELRIKITGSSQALDAVAGALERLGSVNEARRQRLASRLETVQNELTGASREHQAALEQVADSCLLARSQFREGFQSLQERSLRCREATAQLLEISSRARQTLESLNLVRRQQLEVRAGLRQRMNQLDQQLNESLIPKTESFSARLEERTVALQQAVRSQFFPLLERRTTELLERAELVAERLKQRFEATRDRAAGDVEGGLEALEARLNVVVEATQDRLDELRGVAARSNESLAATTAKLGQSLERLGEAGTLSASSMQKLETITQVLRASLQRSI